LKRKKTFIGWEEKLANKRKVIFSELSDTHFTLFFITSHISSHSLSLMLTPFNISSLRIGKFQQQFLYTQFHFSI
jgi:hypothetical protein